MFDSILCNQSLESEKRPTSDSTLKDTSVSEDEDVEAVQQPDALGRSLHSYNLRSSFQRRNSSSLHSYQPMMCTLRKSSSSQPDSTNRRGSWQNFSTSFRSLSIDDEDDLLKLKYEVDFEHQILKYLRKNYLFVSLNDEKLDEFAKKFEAVTYNVGSFIIKQGEADDDCYFYVVVDGECSIIKNGKQLPLVMPKGSSFGEHAVLFGSASGQGSSIVASKGSVDSDGCVVLYRLAR